MHKGLGIGALIVSIVAIFSPVIGIWLTVLAAILAAFAFGEGIAFGIASIVTNIVNLLFLSPSVWLLAVGGAGMDSGTTTTMLLVLFGTQIAAGVFLFLRHKSYKEHHDSISTAPNKVV
jgi:hypothetical protein